MTVAPTTKLRNYYPTRQAAKTQTNCYKYNDRPQTAKELLVTPLRSHTAREFYRQNWLFDIELTEINV